MRNQRIFLFDVILLRLFLLEVRVIQSTAAELDKLTPQIVSAAVATRRNPDDAVAKDHLELLRREWASKVQLLTGSLDEITDKGHFMAASGIINK